MMDEDEKRYLLGLARKSMMHFLEKGETLEVKPEEVNSKKLVEEGACFVTIHIDDQLRGCIGSLEAKRPLVFDVAENAINAAIRDPRFSPLTMEELEKAKISISVLTKPVPFPVKSPDELLEKLEPGRHGLILKQGIARATFLPCVWEQLPDKLEFLAHLSMKAGLSPEGWKDPETEFLVYEAEEFSE
jgi:AmmeMemoRadiSam system protein A